MTSVASTRPYAINGTGLGLRRGPLMRELETAVPDCVSFFEVAPENWLSVGGALGKRFRAFTERHPFALHGLSLSIGSPAPLDEGFVKKVGAFMRAHGITVYTEHLSYCGDDGHLYDLMPIPFTAEAVDYVAARIRRVQDILGQRIGMENVSYYAAPGAEMTELEFVNAVLERADCDLLLDVNNVFVNAINHRYDPRAFMRGVPAARVKAFHVAGHFVEAEDLRVDTHGDDVCDPVWALLDEAYALFGPKPTLLERDFNIPPLATLEHELSRIAKMQKKGSDSISDQARRSSAP
jgi:uncharacterized protein (UPF0276 family)